MRVVGEEGSRWLRKGKGGSPGFASKKFPKPETFSEEWMRQITSSTDLKNNLIFDHLKDTTIVAKDECEIKCHGLILSTRSKVFKAMLEPSKEVGNTINLKDFNASTIHKMLWFMYTDNLDESESEIDMDLLTLANMYQIEALQISCEKKLCNEISIDNVLDAWSSAYLLKRTNLLDRCETFIRKHWMAIQKTESMSRLIRDNSEAMASLMAKLLTIINAPSNKKMEEESQK